MTAEVLGPPEKTPGGGGVMSGAATFAYDHVFSAENDPSWREQAACLGVDSNVFFVDRGAKATEAKQICGGCPVQAECLEYALKTRPVYGIWGGLNHNERWDVAQGRRQHHDRNTRQEGVA